ncbi:LysR family transcriptional regulator [Streptomyces erythrochromogenes]|uniref:LysR family transcriptional regulator n=1 Tax=Streptomyces erythrochromogenes TaxID=285574 RepID=UPI0036B1C34A
MSSSAEPVIDANLAVALDALLTEQSVTRAAARLRTSPAAMSRTLARLRRILQDPLLVRAGQAMVPTPRAEALRDETAAVVRRLGVLLAPGAGVDPAVLRATFTLQTADSVGAALAPGLLRLARQEAPGVSLRFRAEELEAGPALRDGRIDLEIGSIDHVDPETRTEALVTLRMAAAVRVGHPLTEGALTPERLAAADHVVVSRRGRFTGPLDAALAERDLRRRVAVVLPGHLAAMTLAARSDTVCLVPTALPGDAPSPLTDIAGALGLCLLDIPLALPPLTIGMAWHPRHAADGGHRWLRDAVRRTLHAPGGRAA